MSNEQTLQSYLDGPHCQDVPDDLKSLIGAVCDACRAIADVTRHGPLAGNLAASRGTNVQDEVQKELDVRANEIIIDRMEASGLLRALASEEMEESLIFDSDAGRSSRYFLVFDPLDGSTNIEVNGPVGTIFSVLPADDGVAGSSADMLIAGDRQVAAGYVLYGPCTVLVLTLGNGAVEFTLDPESGTFVMTDAEIVVPRGTSEFAINASNQRYWEAPVQRYVSECLAGKDGPRGRDFNMRWVGAMVADVHRVLSRSGVFMYPIDEKTRAKGGRLRLLYEANPMSLIAEQAGGRAIDGHGRILEIEPASLHQRVPVIIGSEEEVDRLASYHVETQN